MYSTCCYANFCCNRRRRHISWFVNLWMDKQRRLRRRRTAMNGISNECARTGRQTAMTLTACVCFTFFSSFFFYCWKLLFSFVISFSLHFVIHVERETRCTIVVIATRKSKKKIKMTLRVSFPKNEDSKKFFFWFFFLLLPQLTRWIVIRNITVCSVASKITRSFTPYDLRVPLDYYIVHARGDRCDEIHYGYFMIIYFRVAYVSVELFSAFLFFDAARHNKFCKTKKDSLCDPITLIRFDY